MNNCPTSTVQNFSRPHTLSRSTFTVSSRESLRQTISEHFAAMGVYLFPHEACCNRCWDSVITNPRRLFRIRGIRIPPEVARLMALERRSGTC